MPSSSSARTIRTAISPRLATRTFPNMRRKGIRWPVAEPRRAARRRTSVAELAAAVRAGALERDPLEEVRPPTADPAAGDRLGAVLAAAGPAPAVQRLGQAGPAVAHVALGNADQVVDAGAMRFLHRRRGTRRRRAGTAPRPPCL